MRVTEVHDREGPSHLSLLEAADFGSLFEVLHLRGYRIAGPTLRDGAICCDEIEGVDDLPIGLVDEQAPGVYRLAREGVGLFDYTVGPQSWKTFLYPPSLRLWTAERDESGFSITPDSPPETRYALLGVRACELHGIRIQDRVFMRGDAVDPAYSAVRDGSLIIAVSCGRAGGTCFCASMDAGPRLGGGYDVALTEVMASGRHYFVCESGSEAGAEILEELPQRRATPEETSTAESVIERGESDIRRKLDPDGLREFLSENREHPHWEDVGARCVGCANCTMVCPTCFCSSVEDTTSLSGDRAERRRVWDSCFTMEFSYIHGGHVRSSSGARFRQWMNHKLSTWHDQFGSTGCVGCGRCITWCPVGIDITEEIRAMRAASQAGQADVSPEG